MRRVSIAVAIAAVFASSTAIAQDSDFSLKGFGTLGLVRSNTTNADFASSFYYQPTGAGNTRQVAFNVDSKLGLQADWKATSSLSVTAQVISKQMYDKTYTPDLEWAFVKYAVSSDLDIRVGRIRPPLYMLSDFLDVNYANPWVRPPVEFYFSAPISRIEGIDALWRQNIGDTSILFQPYAGKSKSDLPGNSEMEAKNMLGFNLSATMGDLTIRGGYVYTKITVDSPGFKNSVAPALTAICSVLPAPARDPSACTQLAALNPTDKKATFASLGMSYDNGEYFLSSEYGKRSTESFIADGTSWYVSGGTRLGKWTPYTTYSSFKNDSPVRFTGGTFPGSAAFGLPATNTIVTLFLQNNPMDQNTLTLGVRYDIAKNVALKGQYDLISTKLVDGVAGTGGGLFLRDVPKPSSFPNGSNDVKVVSAAIDFVF